MPTNTIQTSEDVAESFKKDLRELLAKYDAEMEADDHYRGYPECGEDIRITVTIPSIYDHKGDTIRPWTEVDLGRFVII
jgi:hypothetical protein